MTQDIFVDDANVPVDIWLKEQPDGTWHLQAANYMPRRQSISSEGIDFYGTKEECLQIIQEQIIPLYEIALQTLRKMITGELDHLYYWDLTPAS